jgi:hypothetical protein
MDRESQRQTERWREIYRGRERRATEIEKRERG